MSKDVEFTWHGDEVLKQIEEAAFEGLKVFSEIVLTDAKKKCPVDTGALKNSGDVEGKPLEKVIEVSFSTPYAHKVHEDPKQPKNKYLEKALDEKSKNAEKIIAQHIKRKIK